MGQAAHKPSAFKSPGLSRLAFKKELAKDLAGVLAMGERV